MRVCCWLLLAVALCVLGCAKDVEHPAPTELETTPGDSEPKPP